MSEEIANRTGTEIKQFIFNTGVLVTWEVALKCVKFIADGNPDWKEPIEIFHDVHEGKYRFKRDEPVADVHNLQRKMYVRRIVRQRVQCGYNEDKTPKFRNRIVGVDCYWWADQNGVPVNTD